MKNFILSVCLLFNISLSAQVIDADKVMIIGRNALYYEDYVLAIQYFNQVVKAKPYLSEPYYYRAVAKFLLEDFKGAEEDCTSCIERNPFITNAYFVRGDSRLNLGDYDGAIEDYDKSLTMVPENKPVLTNLSLANIQKKDYTRAEDILNKLVVQDSSYVQAYLIRGSMFLEKGDTIQAINDYNKAIVKDPYLSQSYSRRGVLYSQLKEYDKALADFDEAIKLEPLFSGNYINRGLVKYYKDDYRGAMADYDKVVDLEPNNIIGRFNRGLLRAQVGDDNRAITDFDVVLTFEPSNYIAYFNRALLKSNTGDYKGAISDFDKVLDEYPDFYQGFYARSDLKKKIKDTQGADKDFRYAKAEEDRIRKAIFAGKEPAKKEGDKTREKSDNTIDKFNLLMVADKTEQEKNKYNNATRGKVQNQQVNVDLEPIFVISYYEKFDEVKKAVHFYSRIDELNKKRIFSQLLKITNAETSLTQEQIAFHFASIDEFSKQIDNNKEDSLLYLGRAIDYMLVQNFPSAIEDLNKAVAINPNFAIAHFCLGVIYTKQLELNEKNKQDITSQQDETGKINLKDAGKTVAGDMQGTLPGVDFKSPEYNLAIKSFSKAIEIDPRFVYAYYDRASVKASLRNYQDAILDYNIAINLDPEFAEAYFNRGICRLLMGDKDKGIVDMRKAGEMGMVNAYGIIKRMTNN